VSGALVATAPDGCSSEVDGPGGCGRHRRRRRRSRAARGHGNLLLRLVHRGDEPGQRAATTRARDAKRERELGERCGSKCLEGSNRSHDGLLRASRCRWYRRVALGGWIRSHRLAWEPVAPRRSRREPPSRPRERDFARAVFAHPPTAAAIRSRGRIHCSPSRLR